MKLLVIPKSLENIEDKIDGIIIGLKDYSVTIDIKCDIKEIEELKKNTNKEIFIVINKAIFNNEIEKIETILKKLEEIQIDGIFFYDLSILSIVKRMNLKLNLIWNQTHMVTNYNTCNYYNEQGVYGALLANEITLNEMIEIKEKTKMKIFANIIFRPVMSFSRRTLLTNYFKSFDKDIDFNEIDIHEKVTDKKYLVKEESDGTSIIYSDIVNGIEPLFEMVKRGFDYVIVDMTYIDNEKIIDIVKDVIDSKQIDKEMVISQVNSMIGNDTGFFYKETIYKVKGTNK